jgi:putative protease
VPLTAADRQPLNTERLRQQLGRLGGTPFKLGGLKNALEGAVILPVSELNRLRRHAVVELERLRAQPKRWTLNSSGFRVGNSDFKRVRANSEGETRSPELIVLVRSLPQLEAALRCSIHGLLRLR